MILSYEKHLSLVVLSASFGNSGQLRQLPERSVDSAMQGTSEQCWNRVFNCIHWELVGLHPRKVTWKLKMSLFDKESFATQRFWTGCSFLGVPFGGNVSFVNSCLRHYDIFKTATAQNRPNIELARVRKCACCRMAWWFRLISKNHNHSCQAFFSELKCTASFGCVAFG